MHILCAELLIMTFFPCLSLNVFFSYTYCSALPASSMVCLTLCHHPHCEEFMAQGSGTFSKPEVALNHSLQGKGADLCASSLGAVCGTVGTENQGYLFSMLCSCTKIFSLTANQHGSWFLDRSYFQGAGCCTTASVRFRALRS